MPLRLLGGLHYLVLTGQASWDEVGRALADHADFLRRFTAEQGIQPNEVRRSWVLAPFFLLLARDAGVETLDLVELGASAGFNLLWDRYRHHYERGAWVPERAPLTFEGEERRAVPGDLLAQRPVVRRRLGIDLNPLDMRKEEDFLLLKSFVWADQNDRLELLGRAAEAVRQDPPELRRGRYAELLPEVLRERRPGALTVVFQTASMGYLTDRERERVHVGVEDAAREEPLGWISASAPLEEGMTAWGMDARLLPRPRRILAHADFHGTWLDWFPA